MRDFCGYCCALLCFIVQKPATGALLKLIKTIIYRLLMRLRTTWSGVRQNASRFGRPPGRPVGRDPWMGRVISPDNPIENKQPATAQPQQTPVTHPSAGSNHWHFRDTVVAVATDRPCRQPVHSPQVTRDGCSSP